MNLSSASFQFVVTVLGCSKQTFCQVLQPMNWLTASTSLHSAAISRQLRTAAASTCFQPTERADTFIHVSARQAYFN